MSALVESWQEKRSELLDRWQGLGLRYRRRNRHRSKERNFVLIKSADDKSKRLALYEDLQNSARLDAWQKDQLRKEITALRRGIQGEKDAAHYLDSYFRLSSNHALIHDLRIELDGEVAQIDHLLINRTLDIYMLETKNFSGDVTITPHGEFSVTYSGERVFNIPSPIEQSKRHENVLRRLIAKLGITGRAGTSPRFKHVVLVDPKAAIHRPDQKLFDSSMVIRADLFRTWQERHIDKEMSTSDLLTGVLNLRGTEAVKEIAEKIRRQHRPENLLAMPAWLSPKASMIVAEPSPPATYVKSAPARTKEAEDLRQKKLICMTCNCKISFPEGKFCWNNEKRFKGNQYCREHQASFQ